MELVLILVVALPVLVWAPSLQPHVGLEREQAPPLHVGEAGRCRRPGVRAAGFVVLVGSGVLAAAGDRVGVGGVHHHVGDPERRVNVGFELGGDDRPDDERVGAFPHELVPLGVGHITR